LYFATKETYHWEIAKDIPTGTGNSMETYVFHYVISYLHLKTSAHLQNLFGD